MISAGYLEYRYLKLFVFTNLFKVPSLYFALYLKIFLSKSTIEKRVLNKKNPITRENTDQQSTTV